MARPLSPEIDLPPSKGRIMEPVDLFRRWFSASIEKLKELPTGDGAFAALMIAFPLYERYIVAKLKLDGQPTESDDVRAEMSRDLGLTDQQRSRFWKIFRVGFTHQAMGGAGATPYLVSHVFGDRPQFHTIDGVETVCLDPWKFADRVLNEFISRPELITASESFPLAGIFAMQVTETNGEAADA